jgi:putative glutamine amidotransferase
MPPLIAIPIPHSGDPEYAARSLPQYERAVELAGGEPVCIPLDQSPAELKKLVERCDGVLLPGSKADVNPAKYGESLHPKTAPSDSKRDSVDGLLLQHAYDSRKPILGICYGLQSLNVYRSGKLLQHIDSPINHAAGRQVAVAHEVKVDPVSKLAKILRAEKASDDQKKAPPKEELLIPVNSSHHQSVAAVGDGLQVVALCPEDKIVEAVEGTSPDHFVLAVQWHPERTIDDERSQAIFRALVEASR